MKRARSKFGVRTDAAGKLARTYKGRLYASIAEARYAAYLDTLVKAGEVQHWAPQPAFVLHGVDGSKVCTYVSDFDIVYADGTRRLVDVKGIATPVFKLKQKLFEAEYPDLPLDVVKAGRRYA
jgi:hypothetical protein